MNYKKVWNLNHMVKAYKPSHQLLSKNNHQINPRFAPKRINFKVTQRRCSLMPQSPTGAVIDTSFRHEEWAIEFGNDVAALASDMSHLNRNTQCENYADNSSTIDFCFMNTSPTSLVPQSYWDDLFDKALSALNTVPIDDGLMENHNSTSES